MLKTLEMVQLPMNADKRRLKTHNLSALICVYQRPICLFQQPVRPQLPAKKVANTPKAIWPAVEDRRKRDRPRKAMVCRISKALLA
jgi:hypothetical protein